jgi:hypothetical protein
MEKPPFQFRLRAVFAAFTVAASLLAAVSAITGKTTAFGTFLGAMVLCATATLIVGFFIWAIFYLAVFLIIIIFESRARQPSCLRFRMAALSLAAVAVVFGACLLVGVFIVD